MLFMMPDEVIDAYGRDDMGETMCGCDRGYPFVDYVAERKKKWAKELTRTLRITTGEVTFPFTPETTMEWHATIHEHKSGCIEGLVHAHHAKKSFYVGVQFPSGTTVDQAKIAMRTVHSCVKRMYDMFPNHVLVMYEHGPASDPIKFHPITDDVNHLICYDDQRK